jgi:alpha-tubulin suppressor-like RCC1 family protein
MLLCRCCAGVATAWGCNLQNQCGIPGAVHVSAPTTVHALLGVHIVEVAAGLNHTLARSASGDVYSWGVGDCGQLGHSKACYESSPRLLEDVVLDERPVVSIACGSRHVAYPCTSSLLVCPSHCSWLPSLHDVDAGSGQL